MFAKRKNKKPWECNPNNLVAIIHCIAILITTYTTADHYNTCTWLFCNKASSPSAIHVVINFNMQTSGNAVRLIRIRRIIRAVFFFKQRIIPWSLKPLSVQGINLGLPRPYVYVNLTRFLTPWELSYLVLYYNLYLQTLFFFAISHSADCKECRTILFWWLADRAS